MQTLIFTFAYLMIFVFAVALLWAIVAEAFVLLNIKTNFISKIKSPLVRVYRWMQLSLKSANAKRVTLNFGKSFSQAS